MSRTYNLPQTEVAGTFGQGIPGYHFSELMESGDSMRIIFLSDNDDLRANVGCQNASDSMTVVYLDLFNAYNQSNLRSYDYGTRVFENDFKYVRYPDEELLPFLPSIGLRWEF
mgnify:CR=1 FL=1